MPGKNTGGMHQRRFGRPFQLAREIVKATRKLNALRVANVGFKTNAAWGGANWSNRVGTKFGGAGEYIHSLLSLTVRKVGIGLNRWIRKLRRHSSNGVGR